MPDWLTTLGSHVLKYSLYVIPILIALYFLSKHYGLGLGSKSATAAAKTGGVALKGATALTKGIVSLFKKKGGGHGHGGGGHHGPPKPLYQKILGWCWTVSAVVFSCYFVFSCVPWTIYHVIHIPQEMQAGSLQTMQTSANILGQFTHPTIGIASHEPVTVPTQAPAQGVYPDVAYVEAPATKEGVDEASQQWSDSVPILPRWTLRLEKTTNELGIAFRCHARGGEWVVFPNSACEDMDQFQVRSLSTEAVPQVGFSFIPRT